MARLRREARLESRDARLKLTPRREPYWRRLESSVALGYRRLADTSGTWIVRRYVDSKYRHDRLGSADDYDEGMTYGEAQRLALSQADSAAAVKAAGGRTGYTVNDALDDYLAWYAVHRKGLDQTRSAANAHLRPAWGERRLDTLTSIELRKWHQGLAEGRDKATCNRILTVLKAALNRAWEDGHVASAEPWRRVKPFRAADKPKVRHLTEDECRRLLAACPPDFCDMVRAALLTGCRYGELCALRCSDYHPSSGQVSIRASKGGKARDVPLTDEGRELLDRVAKDRPGDAHAFVQATGEPWGTGLQARRMRDTCKAAGIEPAVSFHILRHCYGSLLAMRGVPLHVIAQVLGHADTRMTSRHYAHLMPSYVADAVRAHLPSFAEPEVEAQT